MKLCKYDILYKQADRHTVRIVQFTAANYKGIFSFN